MSPITDNRMLPVSGPIPLIEVRFLCPFSFWPSSVMVFSSSAMLWFKLRICSTMTFSSIRIMGSNCMASTSVSFFSLDSASLSRLMPCAERILLTLFLRAVRNFTSVSRVCVRLAICACVFSFMRTSGNNPFDKYSARLRASFGSERRPQPGAVLIEGIVARGTHERENASADRQPDADARHAGEVAHRSQEQGQQYSLRARHQPGQRSAVEREEAHRSAGHAVRPHDPDRAEGHRRADPELEPKHSRTGEDHHRGRPEAERAQESDLDQGDRAADGKHSVVGDWRHS